MNTTILRLAFQALFGRKRIIVVALLPMALLALTALIRALAGPGEAAPLISTLGFSLLIPLVSLLTATSVLGPEIEDGSVVYLLATPTSRYVVGISKYVAALIASWLFGALPLAVASLISDTSDARAMLGWGLAGLLSGAAYTALFLALGAWIRHAVVAGLLYVVFWEATLGGLLPGLRWVSIAAWGRDVSAEIRHVFTLTELPLAYSLLAPVVVIALGLWFTGDRLRSFTLKGDAS